MPTPPSTPAEVSRGLSDLTEKLYAHVRVYSEAELDAVRQRAEADVALAKAFLVAEGSVEKRKADAKVSVAQVEAVAAVAEATVRTLKMKIRAIETDIEVHRTYGATVRAELKTLGYEGAA